MADVDYDIRELVSRLRSAHFRHYLLSQGWVEKPSRYAERLYFEGKIHEDEDAYELYFPASTNVARYQTHLMRAIYKLCGIEDREPVEIARDMLASDIAISPPEVSPGVTRLRMTNSGSRPLQVQIDSPPREHKLLPGESIELVCHVDASGLLAIEYSDASLVVRALGKSFGSPINRGC